MTKPELQTASRKRGRYKQCFVKLISEDMKAKYRGDPNNICLRSSWEKDFFFAIIKNDAVLEVGSEEVVIPYVLRTDGTRHRYFMDFHFKIKNRKNEIKRYVVEVKPYKQTQPPVKPKRKTKKSVLNYRKAVQTYVKNICKWEATINWCYQYGYEFRFLTENPMDRNKYKLWKWEDIGLPVKNMRLLG